MGLNSTLRTASRSLELFSAGIEVAGHNISNANDPNFVQERLRVGTDTPYQQGGLLFGTGAKSLGIQQVLDYHLERQIHSANADTTGAQVRADAFTELQIAFSELGTGDLSSLLNEFTGAINELINQPELPANRQIVLQQGAQLANAIQSIREKIDYSRESLTTAVNDLVVEANQLIEEISNLNRQIVKTESAGLLQSDAGGLRSQRLTALNRLSEIIPIRSVERENGMVDIFSGTDFLVINDNHQLLETTTSADRGIPVSTVVFSKTQSELTTSLGELGGSIDAQNSVLGAFADDLDLYAQAVIEEVNRIHASGEGLKGYESITGTYGIEETTVALNQAGLAVTPEHGSFEIKIYDQATDTTTTTLVSIDLDGLNGDDTTLDDLQTTLDSIANLNATIDHLGRLNLSSASGYEIRFSNDTSGTLAALGINTFFEGTDSNDISVNSVIAEDPQLLAVGFGDGPGDNRNAILLAQFIENPSDRLGNISIDDFYESVTANVATSASAENAITDGFKSFQQSLFNLRQQTSGVSLDEEAIRVIQL